MTEVKPKEDLSAYRIYKMTLLQTMALLATLGIVVNIVLHYFF